MFLSQNQQRMTKKCNYLYWYRFLEDVYLLLYHNNVEDTRIGLYLEVEESALNGQRDT